MQAVSINNKPVKIVKNSSGLLQKLQEHDIVKPDNSYMF